MSKAYVLKVLSPQEVPETGAPPHLLGSLSAAQTLNPLFWRSSIASGSLGVPLFGASPSSWKRHSPPLINLPTPEIMDNSQYSTSAYIYVYIHGEQY